MINKLVFLWDFLYHSKENKGTYHWNIVDLMSEQIKLATGLDVTEISNITNANNENFSREVFFKLSNIENIQSCYYNYNLENISDKSWEYLKSFIDSNTLILGVELGNDIRNILKSLNINYVNFWFHSWKLFDDTFLMINTNNKNVFDKINTFKVPKEKFKFSAKYRKHYSIQNDDLSYLNNLEDNSCVFIGQTMKDKSVDKDGKMLNILDFKKELEILSKKYSMVYYVPHPLEKNNKEIDEYIKETPYLKKLEDVDTYHLLMSDKIKKVVGISSSVLYEAQYFNKETEYLFKPLFRIDEEFSIDTYISVFHDYFNPYFWAEILSPIMNTDKNVENRIWFTNLSDKLRNLNHCYYGYSAFDEKQRLLKKISVIIWRENIDQYKLKLVIFKFLKYISFGKFHKYVKEKENFYCNKRKGPYFD